MGNSNTSVAKYANKTFGSFVEQLKLEELKEASSGNFQKHMDYIFSVFLEDFFVCDETFLDFSDDDKVKCAGCLLFLYSTISFSLVEKFPNPPKFGPALLAGFVNDADPSMLLKAMLSSSTCFDGTNLFKWVGDEWVQCEDCDIVCGDCLEDFGSKANVTTLGLTQECAIKGCEAIRAYLELFNNTLSTFDTSESRTEVLSSIKEDIVEFNQKNNAIPCRDNIVLVHKCASRQYKTSDHFTVRLPFNHNQDFSQLVDDYFAELGASDESLANFIISCGSRLSNSITVIYGPKCSGRSTLSNLARTLYGPYACSGSEHDAGNVNYDLVRTCFYNDDSILKDSDLVRNHPCGHIVVISKEEPPRDTFAGRTVRKMHISNPIDKSDRTENILTKLGTRKQLSHVLGWALKKYNSMNFRTGNSNMKTLLQQMIMSQLLGTPSDGLSMNSMAGRMLMSQLLGGESGGCGNSDCPGCSSRSEE